MKTSKRWLVGLVLCSLATGGVLARGVVLRDWEVLPWGVALLIGVPCMISGKHADVENTLDYIRRVMGRG